MIVGAGSQQAVVDRLVTDFPGRVEHHEWLEPEAVSEQLDAATVLVLPSWPEGLGRVIIESFARGRAVVATDGGGIPDLVTNEVEGLLVPPADTTALAAALERVLADRELAERMGAAARVRYGDWHSTPVQLAGRDAGARRGHGRRNGSLTCVSSSSPRPSTPTTRCSRRPSISFARSRHAASRSPSCATSVRRHDLPATSGSGPSARATAWVEVFGSCAPPRHRCCRDGRDPTRCSCTWSRSSCCWSRRSRRCFASRSSSGTRTGMPADRSGLRSARGRRPQRQQRLVPARDREAARDRPRDRRRALHAVGGRSGRRAAAAPRAGQDCALEGLRHDAPSARARDRTGARCAARAPRAAADRGRGRAPATSWRRSSPGRMPARPRSDRASARAGRDPGQAASLRRVCSARPSRARARRSTRWCTRPPRAVCR